MLMCAFFFFRTSYRLIIQTARPQLICRLLLSRRALRARAISLQHTQLFSAHTVTTIDVLLVTMEDCILARLEMRPANKVAPTLDYSGFGSIKYQQRLVAAASLPGKCLLTTGILYSS